MEERASYYEQLSMIDVRKAFQEVRLEIIAAQEALREVLPDVEDNILLHLVSTENDLLKIVPYAWNHLAQTIGVKRSDLTGNIYTGLGLYVDALEREAEKYSSTA